MTGLTPISTKIGKIALIVPDLARASSFYRTVLGFQILEAGDEIQTLGAGLNAIVQLVNKPGAVHSPNSPGLYHFAILLPDRFSLARTLYQLVECNYSLQGASDHGVSEALYLADPDGNGIELYCDRPDPMWPREPDGTLSMTTQALNLDRLLFELKGKLKPWLGIDPRTVVGHVHLQVNDIKAATDFYTKIIGMDLQQTYGSQAAFFSNGGYHHHIGVNTWHSYGADPTVEGAAGLAYFELKLPGSHTIQGIIERAAASGIHIDETDGGWIIRDPSGNRVLLSTE